MSSSALRTTAKKILKSLKDNDFRTSLERQPGQLFIFLRDDFKSVIRGYLIETGYAEDIEKVVEDLTTMYVNKLNAAQRSFKPSRNLVIFKNKVISRQIMLTKPLPPKGAYVYIIRNKGVIDKIKSEIGKALERKTSLSSKYVTGRLEAGSRVAEAVGYQTGHGEYGHAVSAARVIAADRLLKTAKGDFKKGLANSQLVSAVNDAKSDFNIDFELNTSRLIKADGTLSANYVSILSNQATSENQFDAQKEKEILDKLTKNVQKILDVANQKGSPILIDDINAVLLQQFAKEKHLKVRSVVKPQTTIRRQSSSGILNRKITEKTKFKTHTGAPVNLPSIKKRRAAASTTELNRLIPAINQALSAIVARNMGSPALNYRSGRFANSVQAVKFTKTPKGFPTLNYTYMRYPYQVFEYPRGNPNLATPERDPRRTIESSIREIATGLIRQRFYTKRV